MYRNSRQHNFSSLQQSAFTLVELLVVISIIAVLAGILLVALSSASQSATRSQTGATLNSFSAACDSFAMEHGRLPGLVPSHILGDGSDLTTTQNAMLELMGGCRVRTSDEPTDSPTYLEFDQFKTGILPENLIEIDLPDPNNTSRDWEIVVDRSRINEGPWINGKPYPPYLSPKASELVSRWTSAANPNPDTARTQGYNQLPDIYDAWGNPVIFLRRDRKGGPLVQDINDAQGEAAQFSVKGLGLYVEATALGDDRYRQKQDTQPTSNAISGSRLTGSGGDGNDEEQRLWLTTIVAHPHFYQNNGTGDFERWYGTASGSYILLSAGPDGIYLSHQDGPVNTNGGFTQEWDEAHPDQLEDFDDIIVNGGG